MKKPRILIALVGAGAVLSALAMVAIASPAEASTAIPTGQTVNLIGLGSGKCVSVQGDPSGNVGSDGLTLVQQDCNYGNNAQRWTFIRSGAIPLPGTCHWYDTGCVLDPVYQIVNLASNKCMDVRDGNGADGTPIQQWTCNGGDTMLWWAIRGDTAPYQQLRNVRTGSCLDVFWNLPDAGAPLQEYHCTRNNGAQQFFPGVIG